MKSKLVEVLIYAIKIAAAVGSILWIAKYALPYIWSRFFPF